MITLKLLDTEAQIEKKINKALAREFNKILRKKEKFLLGRLKRSVESWVRASPEIQSLDDRQAYGLGAEFGIRKSKAGPAIEAIINAIVDATVISANKFTEDLKGSIYFYFQPADFVNLLQLQEGHVVTQKGSDLHWLDWLLTKGDQMIIQGYEYQPSRDGRSGGGTMEKGVSFRVNPKYSGIESDNFVTRLFDKKESEITNLIAGIFNG